MFFNAPENGILWENRAISFLAGKMHHNKPEAVCTII
jgi:hypothetical protein